MEQEFESRIAYREVKLRTRRYSMINASVYWEGKLYETVQANKRSCIDDLKIQAKII